MSGTLELEGEVVNLGRPGRSERRGSLERDRELEASEHPEALPVEETNCLQVARDGPHVDVLDPETSRLCDGLLGQERADPVIAMTRIHDDGLELGLLSANEEPAEAEDAIWLLRNPDAMQVWLRQIRVELQPGIRPADRLVTVDVTMSLREAPPQLPTSLQIAGLILWDGCRHVRSPCAARCVASSRARTDPNEAQSDQGRRAQQGGDVHRTPQTRSIGDVEDLEEEAGDGMQDGCARRRSPVQPDDVRHQRRRSEECEGLERILVRPGSPTRVRGDEVDHRPGLPPIVSDLQAPVRGDDETRHVQEHR